MSSVAPATPKINGNQLATFAAGCFWGVQKFFRQQFKDSIVETAVGYTGGTSKNPSYELVCTGSTSHAEALRIEFDPTKVQYEDLVLFFYRIHDASTLNRQGNDVGTQYRSAIFYHDEEQLQKAKKVSEEVQKQHYPGKTLSTTFEPAKEFYYAEDYHQEYLAKNPGGYCNHRLRW